jgi:hypothetical protein
MAPILFIASLVMAGIAALFYGMPLEYQPAVTPLFVHLSTSYLLYGAHPMYGAGLVVVAFSSITVLLACFPLFDALRSSGSKRMAVILLSPLVLFSLVYLAYVGRYCLWVFGAPGAEDVFQYSTYFNPASLVGSTVSVESVKWCIVLVIAVWLSFAQVAASWKRRTAKAASA